MGWAVLRSLAMDAVDMQVSHPACTKAIALQFVRFHPWNRKGVWSD